MKDNITGVAIIFGRGMWPTLIIANPLGWTKNNRIGMHLVLSTPSQ
jgi:hypothetical protein